jgi:hypothetical protein
MRATQITRIMSCHVRSPSADGNEAKRSAVQLYASATDRSRALLANGSTAD